MFSYIRLKNDEIVVKKIGGRRLMAVGPLRELLSTLSTTAPASFSRLFLELDLLGLLPWVGLATKKRASQI